VLFGLCAALLGGLLVWLFIRSFHPVFWTTEGADQFGFLPVDVQSRLDRNNAMLLIGLLGGVTGAVLAVVEGLHRRSWITVLVAPVVGAACGALFGVLGGYLGHGAFEAFKGFHNLSDLTKSMGVFALMFGLAGAGIGLGTGLTLGRGLQSALSCLVAGLVAGGLAALLYPLVVGAILPGALTSVLVPVEPVDQLVWLGLATGLVGLIVPSVTKS